MDNRSEVDNQKRLQKESAAELAVGALEGNPNPIDMDMRGIDPAPTSLDMPEEEYDETRSNPRCAPSALGVCRECGRPFGAPARPRA